MPCYNCNYQYGNYSCAVCRGQVASMMPGVVGYSRIGEKLGESLASLVLGILANRFLSFPSFYIGAQTLILMVASTIGIIESWNFETMPVWFVPILVGVPVFLMIVYRKKMPLLAVETFRYVLIVALLKLFYYVISAPG